MIPTPLRVNGEGPFGPDLIPQFLNNGWLLALDESRVILGWGDWETSENAPEHGATFAALYAPDFYLNTSSVQKMNAWRWTSSWQICERPRLAQYLSEYLSKRPMRGVQFNLNNFVWAEPSKDEFFAQFKVIREGFEMRGLKKAVPIVFAVSRGAIDAEGRLSILHHALSQPAHLFPYGFWSADDGMIGVTPEILFTQKDPQALETVALAGTRALISIDANESREATIGRVASALLSDTKERHEHQLVIDDIQAVLKTRGDAQIAQTDVVVLPSLVHLKTQITAVLDREFSFTEIVSALHPTPALGVSPRALGFTEMHKWESGRPRNRYGAPFGVTFTPAKNADAQHRHCVVGIRNIQWQGSEIQLGSGCGIVPQSELDREWEELKLKRDSVRKMLGL